MSRATPTMEMGELARGSVPQFVDGGLQSSTAGAKLAGRIGAPELTERELSVLRCVAAGQANKEVAAALGISEGTLKSHVNKIMQKLGALSRTDAVMVGLRKGLIKI